MKKLGISTVYTGYNYGSALQAFAVKKICEELGYAGEVLHLGGSVIPGRDVRIGKAFSIAFRLLSSPKQTTKSARAYANGLAKVAPVETQRLFNSFIYEYIDPVVTNWKGLKLLGKQSQYAAFLCGSDQIWNADTLYVDPQYYLRYAPKYKRIAFAPSFGRHSVAKYNKRQIGKYVEQIPYLSVREQTGVSIIEEIANRDAVCLLDPTLFFDRLQWIEYLGISTPPEEPRYLLAYFLDKPSENAKKCIQKIAREKKLEIVSLPYRTEDEDWFDHTSIAGPIEFVSQLANAAFVCTDSFHGTAFSLIMQVPFYTFDREYGAANKQSTRIESLLKLVNLYQRFCPSSDALSLSMNFDICKKTLAEEKERTKEFLMSAISAIDNHCEGEDYGTEK